MGWLSTQHSSSAPLDSKSQFYVPVLESKDELQAFDATKVISRSLHYFLLTKFNFADLKTDSVIKCIIVVHLLYTEGAYKLIGPYDTHFTIEITK
jgi:hypothetical protein